MNKQELYRKKYKTLKPKWNDSLDIYKDLIGTEVSSDTKILDIGCGHGDFLENIYSRTQNTYGLDPDEQGLKKNNIIKHKKTGLADDIPFQDDFFDLVVSSWVLEHLEDPQKVFEEIYRVLKPGGHFIFLTPNSWNYVVWVNRLIPDLFHDFLTKKLYNRQENDTFPTRYKINSVRKIQDLIKDLNFQQKKLILNGDPTYISFDYFTFKFSCLIEKVLNIKILNSFKVHIIAKYQK